MALWRSKTESSSRAYCRKLIKAPLSGLIRHESFFISDGGGQNGIRIDYVERRQAAQRLRTKIAGAKVDIAPPD